MSLELKQLADAYECDIEETKRMSLKCQGEMLPILEEALENTKRRIAKQAESSNATRENHRPEPWTYKS